jgi:hypothetical protein
MHYGGNIVCPGRIAAGTFYGATVGAIVAAHGDLDGIAECSHPAFAS